MLWNALIHPSSAPHKAGGWLLILTVFASLAGCGDLSCDGNDPVVVAARALSEERLERLYADAEHVIRTKPKVLGEYWDDTDGPVPEWFKDFKPIKIRVQSRKRSSFPQSVSLMLKGCFDHYIYLDVTSIGTADARIEIKYGEGPSSGTEVLWRREAG